MAKRTPDARPRIAGQPPLLAFGLAVVCGVSISLWLLEPFKLALLSAMVVAGGLGGAVAHGAARKQGRLARTVLLSLPWLLFGAVCWSQAPLRLAFLAYRPQFEQVARSIETGREPQTPLTIGPFRIVAVGRRYGTGTPYLATVGPPGDLEGFVRDPAGRGFNLWSCVRLNDHWSFVSED